MTLSLDVLRSTNGRFPRSLAGPSLPALLATAAFVNSVLLFSAEPMFSKLLLPLLGGTPIVWNTCLVFFQAALLAGYAYAHLTTRFLGPRWQPRVHVALLVLSCLALPLRVHSHAAPPLGGLSVIWLLGLLLISLGPPFIMLASGSLIVQRWLADSDDRQSTNPYFLYAASNLGSLIALLSYPLLIEPWLTLSAQRATWSAAYALLVAGFAAFAWRGRRNLALAPHVSVRAVAPESKIGNAERALWVLYSAVPSALLVAVTTYLSTDVAAVPLLWVLPLAVYLLTFVIVFARRQIIRASWMLKAETYLLIVAVIPILGKFRVPALPGIALNLLLLFAVAMVCHRELVRRKPRPSGLTEFFVWLSLGGLLGGVFTALAAPVVFNTVLEYPIVITAAAVLRPHVKGTSTERLFDLILPCLIGAAVFALALHSWTLTPSIVLFLMAGLGIVLFSFRDRPLRFGMMLALLFVASNNGNAIAGSRLLYTGRSFFGVYRIQEERGSTQRTLSQGTTVHGAQSLIPGEKLIPLTYYSPQGPAGDIFEKTAAGRRVNRHVAVVGLGAGALACYGATGEQWTFYEIDPLVASIARDARLFTFLRDCPPSEKIVIGDARLSLGRAQGSDYDLLILDAFSSDAIPLHLLTREALHAYLMVVAPGGAIAFHISNRHLDLEPVIAELARDARVVARIRRDPGARIEKTTTARYPSNWVVLARDTSDLGDIAGDHRWHALERRAGVVMWTDDFSNILRVFDWDWRS